jgi:YYY domain-containing protein
MIWFFSWLLVVEAIGAGTLPLAMRLFRRLPDRGVVLAKPLGILLIGYFCWILGVLGILRFQQATALVVLVVMAAGCWVLWGKETLKQLSGLGMVVVASEAVFLLGLVGAALIRAHNPDISGTEKPMDFAILNALYRTDTLPAEDPWMSGHSISYYYFGYLLLALVSKLSAVPAAVGYNLGVSLVYALLLAGSFSLAFNILTSIGRGWSLSRRLLGALVAPIVIGVMGNLEVGLEVLAARGYSNDAFWRLVAIKGLAPATQPDGWLPTSFWWWWRASRIIPTIKPDGITEFPYFSFILGDLHPHFIALPWALLTVGLALAAILNRVADRQNTLFDWTGRVTVAIALGFLLVGNSWDFPSYTALFWLGALVPLGSEDWKLRAVLPRLKELALISLLSVLLYAPFFLGFASQTKGIGLSSDRTPLVSLLIIFGPVLFAIAAFAAWQGWSATAVQARSQSSSRLLPAFGGLLIASSLLLGSAALLVGILVLAIAAYRKVQTDATERNSHLAATVFVLTLAALGLILVTVPEFVFLVDLFGTRMNTVFKFQYEAWLLLGLAASVGTVCMAGKLKPAVLRWAILTPPVLLVAVGLLYPWAATVSKTQDYRAQPTLDGAAFYQSVRPDDFAAIQWLSSSAQGRPVVLEATGGEYSEYARVSTFSGLPSVLGWAGHEVQWRGRGEEPQQRTQDIDAIYSTADRTTVSALLAKYRVRYVFVGSLEVEKYGPGVAGRFSGILEPVFRQGAVTVYRVPAQSGTGTSDDILGLTGTPKTWGVDRILAMLWRSEARG